MMQKHHSGFKYKYSYFMIETLSCWKGMGDAPRRFDHSAVVYNSSMFIFGGGNQ